MQLSELGRRGQKENALETSKEQQTGFEPELSQVHSELREHQMYVWHLKTQSFDQLSSVNRYTVITILT